MQRVCSVTYPKIASCDLKNELLVMASMLHIIIVGIIVHRLSMSEISISYSFQFKFLSEYAQQTNIVRESSRSGFR